MTETAREPDDGPLALASQNSMGVDDKGHIPPSPTSYDGIHDINMDMDTMVVEPNPDHSLDNACEEGKDKGKGKALVHADTDVPMAAAECPLLALPNELIDSILSYLPPVDLNHVSETCHALYNLATDDHLWQAHVQDNVPGQVITSSYPCASFRELYAAHDPRWFLPKYKVWFADATLLGRLIVARYDQRRGCIEAYYLLATNRENVNNLIPWQPGVFISPFDPKIKLFLDRPCVRLTAKPDEDDDAIFVLKLHEGGGGASDDESGPSDDESGPSNDESGPSTSITELRSRDPHSRGWKVFEPEFPMSLSPQSTMKSTFHHTRCVSFEEMIQRCGDDFPYRNIWPPPAVPAFDRVLGAGLERPTYLRAEDRPALRSEVHDKTFRTCNWFEMASLESNIPPREGRISFTAEARALARAMRRQPTDPLVRRVPVGEEIATYATIGPEVYTPTPSKPFRGIWVGDYGAHGCEFLLLTQPDDDDFVPPLDPDSISRLDGETDAQYAKRQRDAVMYRGRLEAVKLTGDANVPRGEVTFVVDELGNGGTEIHVEHPNMTFSARAIESRGHIARTGFANDEYIETELWVISPDRLAHYWKALGHISFFHRVDIDQFVVPD